MTFGFARKIGMTRLFIDGVATPVTALELGDNAVLMRKTQEKDGYNAIQLAAFGKYRTNQAKKGHIEKHAKIESPADNYQCMSEFCCECAEDKNSIDIEDVQIGQVVDVQANSIGRGFTGVMKRWNFKGQPKSHGHDHPRAVGSIGDMGIQKVQKGKKMAGRKGGKKITVKNLKVVAVDADSNLFYVAGHVPGANKGYVKFQPAKTAKQVTN